MHTPARGLRRLAGGRALELLFVAVSHTWLTLRLAMGVEPATARPDVAATEPLGWLLVMGAALGTGAAAFAIALHVPLERAALARSASPRSQRWRIALGLAGGLLALAGGAAFGGISLITSIILLAAIGLRSFVGRFIPPIGIVTLGLIHVLVMAAPNPRLTFVFPLLLVFTHVVIVEALLHQRSPRRSPIRQRGWIGISAGWVFWVLVAIALTTGRAAQTGGGAMTHAAEALHLSWIGPLLGFATFCFLLPLLARHVRKHRAAPEQLSRLTRLATVWLIVYNAAWLASIGDWLGTSLITALLATALLARLVLDLLVADRRAG